MPSAICTLKESGTAPANEAAYGKNEALCQKEAAYGKKCQNMCNACHQYKLEHEWKKAVVHDGKETIAH